MLTLLELKKRVSAKNFNLTCDEALDLGVLFKADKYIDVIYDWEENSILFSLWDIEFNIIDREIEK